MDGSTYLKTWLVVSIFTLVFLVAGVHQADAGNVPFGDANTIDGSFDGAISVYAADIDGDGDLDVLGAARFAHDIAWWENENGLGSAWTKRTVDDAFNTVQSVYAADVDGDGDMDVLGAAWGDDDITWWENANGLGTSWTEHTVDGAFNWAASVYAADVDGDGDLDVLGAAYNADDIAWWENTAADGNGTTWTEHTVDADFDGAYSVYAADVDGDGDVDVLGAAKLADDITWWENENGLGTSWTKRTVDDVFNGASSVYAADVDGDGDLDVLGAASGASDITWWENENGLGTSWTERTVDGTFSGAISVYAADVDRDGDIDVLGTAYSADDITWWENTAGDGTAWTEHTVDADFDGAWGVYAADIDGDGDLDVLGAAESANDIAWWENTDSNGTAWTEHTVDADFDATYSVYAADVDGDGDLDVLGAAFDADDIAWWENANGLGTSWTKRIVDGAFDGARCVYAADVDGDGDVDVLGAAEYGNDITWWENVNGLGTAWTEHDVDYNFDAAFSVYAADVDGDGDLDVLGAAAYADDITWWENANGLGTAWTEHTVDDAFYYAASVYAADVDGDGDMDILGAANTADDITWWESRWVIKGDLDDDGDVDFADFAVFAPEWLLGVE